MVASELALRKNKYVVSELFNLMQTLLVKEGLKTSVFVLLVNCITGLKLRGVSAGAAPTLSPYQMFHNLVSKYTPRVNVITAETKKTDEVIKTPMPPLKKSLLRHNFVVKYVTLMHKGGNYKSLSDRLTDSYQELSTHKKGKLIADQASAYEALNQFRFRVKKRHDNLMRKKKLVSNATAKSKQSYL